MTEKEMKDKIVEAFEVLNGLINKAAKDGIVVESETHSLQVLGYDAPFNLLKYSVFKRLE